MRNVGWVAVGLLAAGCFLPKGGGSAVTKAPYTAADFGRRAPAEVAVLPVTGALDFTAAEAAALRDEAYGQLLGKGYAPLAPEFVDRSLGSSGDAAGAGPPRIADLQARLPTDSYLLLDVLQVDRLTADKPPLYRLHARATLLDGESGAQLFDHVISMPFEARYVEGAALADEQVEDVMRRFGARLLGPLPARRSDRP